VLFELEDVRYTRGGRLVLDRVRVQIPEGVTAVAGASGSGKSSLLRLLVRLSDPDSGTVRFKGRDVRELDVLELRRRAVWVPQIPVLEPGTVAENLALAARLGGRQDGDLSGLLELAGLDRAFADRDAAELSVGERQRAMFARALACEPEALLLDEPTSALDAEAAAAVERTITGLRRGSGVSIVLVTHEVDQAERLADHTIRIDQGRIDDRD
jgi:putative ABC transport system ATP-binding protein